MAQKRKSSGGPTKAHGPKRKLFHEYNKVMRSEMAKHGLLTKYSNFESFKLACIARGMRNPTEADFRTMSLLPTRAAQDEWFKSIKR